TISDDHAAQERVWQELPTYRRSRQAILDRLNEDKVAASDRRARLIGIEAYRAAGGVIIRDLFDEEEGGYFADAELLDRLVQEKLQAEADALKAEGWKWIEIISTLDYEATAALRHLYPDPVALTEEEQARLDALEA